MELEDRLKKFSYVFIRCFEERLKYWQKYLEDRPDKPQPSKPGTIFATAVSAIPKVGKPMANAVKQGDEYLRTRAEKDNAQNMAEITYFSDNNRDAFRKILIEASFDVFCSYECQFSLVTCKGGPLRAMRKLGSDATHRVLTFLLEDKSIKNLTSDVLTKGVVFGKSERNSKKVISSGRTLILNDESISTADFFANTGVRIQENDTITYYKSKHTIHALRHRLLFPWEGKSLAISTCEVDRPEYSYKYKFIAGNKEEQIESIRKFVTTKDPIEDLKEFTRTRDDDLEILLKNASMELKEIHAQEMGDNKEDHHLTRTFIVKSEESIINHLKNMIYETLIRSLEEDRKKREEYDRKKQEEEEERRREEEERRRKEDEERRRKEEEERSRREEEERRRKEETEMLLEKVKSQQENVVVIDGQRVKKEAKRVEECFHRESQKVEREAKRIVNQVKGLKLKW